MGRTLEITTKIGCANMCDYCPQALLIRRYAEREQDKSKYVMSLETFNAILENLPDNKIRIHFSGFCECWLNPECADMVLSAYRRGHRISMYTTLVGLTPAAIERIEDVRFQRFDIHLPNIHEISKIRADEDYKQTLRAILASRIEISEIHCAGTPPDELLEIINPYHAVKCRRLHSRAGNCDEVENSPHRTGPLRCPKSETFQKNVVLPNGDVVLCCMDYGLTRVLGNLCEQSYEELFQSASYQNILQATNSDNDEILCRSCFHVRPKEPKKPFWQRIFG